jgi:hypothetical protein
MAECTARDCYVSLSVASPPCSSIKLLCNCPNFLNNVSKSKIICYYSSSSIFLLIINIYNIYIILLFNIILYIISNILSFILLLSSL